MTAYETTVLRELADLPESRRTDVLAYIRFLKIGLADEKSVRARFASALEEARAEARRRKITKKDIEEEIKAVRAGK